MTWFSQLIVFLFKLPLLMLLASVPAVDSLVRCVEHEQSSLLHLKHSLVFGRQPSLKMATWNSSSDCCDWDGVTCSGDGHVISLKLVYESISGGIEDSNSPLFDLHHLRHLDLSENNFNGIQIPPGIGKLVNLRHLHLSDSNFGGQVPLEISSLTSLLTLDLSGGGSYSPPLKLENPKLSTLVQNLTRLTQLHLDGVNMSAEAHGYKWGHALSSSLPKLQVLSLSRCSLSGPLDISLAKLRALTMIDLSGNNLSCALPDFFPKFSNLTSLFLQDCGLSGKFPQNIFHMVTLQQLALTYNNFLPGTLPDSIHNLKSLTTLLLQRCGLNGTINHIHWENLHKLIFLDLSVNALSGSIPPSLFSLPSLNTLDLSGNLFTGELEKVPITSSSSVLENLYLSRNKLEGSIPTRIFNLESLVELYLSHNNFSGTIDFTNLFQNLTGNLHVIDLSFNQFTIVESVDSGVHSSSPYQLNHVRLVSCNLKAFPGFLRNQSKLGSLDLSCNNIQGEIPSWIWKPSLNDLNLSHNSLIGFETPLHNLTGLHYLTYLDLSSNLLQGHQIPLPPHAIYLDYSSNHFDSIIPVDIGDHLHGTEFLSLSNNNFHGTIPPSICNITTGIASIVNLSNNSLSGTIPPCLIAKDVGALVLRRNKLGENIPDAFQDTCALRTLDLSDNYLQGTVPESIVNCKALEVVNLGNNELNGEFPCWLMQIPNLRVLVLRSNKFYGAVTCALSNATTTSSWPNLQIIDIAANDFGGELPYESFKTWTAMKAQRDTVQPNIEPLGFSYYQDSVTIVNKGLTIEWVKILTIFNLIDFSCNHFEGSIPQSIGVLLSLYALNLSHNRFTGQIPSSLGSLKELESLDLANNSLSGVIPEQIASLSFLSYLNLSFNQLEGKIPTSTQLQSFSEWSYVGNKGLYGQPLRTKCTITCGSNESLHGSKARDGVMEIDWQLIWAEIGYAVGLGAVIGSLVFWDRWRLWYYGHVDRLLFTIFPRLDPNKRNHGRRAHKRRRNQMQRQ